MNLKEQFNLPLRFWIVALIAFVNSVSFTIIIPTIYPYAKQFGLSDFQASLLTTAFALSQFVATPIIGRLSDCFGRKPLLVISLLGTVLANLLASFAPNTSMLFIARILDGITGGNTAVARAVISDTTQPSDRPKAFGLFDASFRLGFMTGPAISYFAQTLPPFPGISSLGMSFFAGAVIAAIATMLAWWLLPETLPEREDFQLSWSMLHLRQMLVSAGRPKLGRVFLLTFMSGMSFTIFTFAFQPFFLTILGQDAQMIAVLFTLTGTVGLLSQLFLVAPLSQRFNLGYLICLALMVRAVIFLLIPTLPYVGVFIALIMTMGAANAFPMPLISSILSTNSSNKEQGEVMGLNASYLSISNAFGPAIAGVLVSISYTTPFWVTGVLTLGAALFALRLTSMLDCTCKAH